MQVSGYPPSRGAEVFTLWEYVPHTWLLLLQVDLQRKVEERNRLLAEYKVMEPLPWGFGWFLGMGMLFPQHLDSPGKELQEPGLFGVRWRHQKFFAFPPQLLADLLLSWFLVVAAECPALVQMRLAPLVVL